jgi:hypothetical protein
VWGGITKRCDYWEAWFIGANKAIICLKWIWEEKEVF